MKVDAVAAIVSGRVALVGQVLHELPTAAGEATGCLDRTDLEDRPLEEGTPDAGAAKVRHHRDRAHAPLAGHARTYEGADRLHHIAHADLRNHGEVHLRASNIQIDQAS